VCIEGCNTSVQKDILQRWRKLQPWVILEVNKFCYSKRDEHQNYYIYFCSSEGSMRYRLPLTANYLALRVGLVPTRFVIGPTTDSNTVKEPMTLRQWSAVFQKNACNGIFHSLEKDDAGMSLVQMTKEDIVWIWFNFYQTNRSQSRAVFIYTFVTFGPWAESSSS